MLGWYLVFWKKSAWIVNCSYENQKFYTSILKRIGIYRVYNDAFQSLHSIRQWGTFCLEIHNQVFLNRVEYNFHDVYRKDIMVQGSAAEPRMRVS
jgi:hypothetical protein